LIKKHSISLSSSKTLPIYASKWILTLSKSLTTSKIPKVFAAHTSTISEVQKSVPFLILEKPSLSCKLSKHGQVMKMLLKHSFLVQPEYGGTILRSSIADRMPLECFKYDPSLTSFSDFLSYRHHATWSHLLIDVN
jgi:hypothetical protein